MAATARRTPGAPTTRDRLLAAAAEEFAARGFDGAKVDRIAARARINKAMLYYHFKSKTALYQAILLDRFGRVAAAVEAVREQGGTPEAQLRGFVEALAGTAFTQPQFPPLWLREIADGGRHLAPPIVSEMSRVVGTLGAILAEGHAAGKFRQVNPLVTQIGIVAPLLFFAATAPVRERFKQLVPTEIANAPGQEVVANVIAATLAAVAPRESRPSPGSSRREKS
ncbi:MAG TPA: TetR/AcrR family transcriptional regulator [Vicinamibacterales bacterium]|nr:TetR/AcrR family transcriptional regulator [Vicinamibacterales bacterium]